MIRDLADPTPTRSTRLPRSTRSPVAGRAGRFAALALLSTVVATSTGCGALLLIGGAGTSAIAFATGELRSREPSPIARLDAACATAVDVLAYDAVETERAENQIRWRARTAAGDPVDIRLVAKGPEATEVRIRIGVFGDEAKSRLVLEEIHQAL